MSALSENQGFEYGTAARQRSDIYGMLARLFGQEMTPELLRLVKDPHFMGVLADLGAQVEASFFDQPEEVVIEELANFAGGICDWRCAGCIFAYLHHRGKIDRLSRGWLPLETSVPRGFDSRRLHQ